jgi:predicted metalloprotease with PDZ domain
VFQGKVGSSIYGVLDDSAAGGAGLAPGDVLTGIQKYAFSPAALTWVGSRAEPVTLTVLRGHRGLSFTLTPTPRVRIASLTWRGTPAQRQRIAAWLGQPDVDLVEGQPIDLSFYENFHGVEVVV